MPRSAPGPSAVTAQPHASSSCFTGVSWHKNARKWKAAIKHEGKTHYLGLFEDEIEAAKAWDAKARSLRGAATATNFNLDGSRVAAASTLAPTLAPPAPAPAPAEPPGQHLDSPPLPELDWHDCGNETLTGVPRSMAIGTNWTAKALFAVSRLGAPLAQLPGLARLIGLVQFPGKKAKVGHLAVLAQVAGADDAILYRLASALFNGEGWRLEEGRDQLAAFAKRVSEAIALAKGGNRRGRAGRGRGKPPPAQKRGDGSLWQ